MTYWALKPYTSLTNLGITFNVSSISTFINLISIFYFILLTIFKNSLPQGKQSLFFIYSLLFFILLSFFLDEDMIPSNESSTGRVKNKSSDGKKIFDFSDTKDDSEILSLG